MLEIRIIFKMDVFKTTDCPIENVQEIWPTKMDFGWPNAIIG